MRTASKRSLLAKIKKLEAEAEIARRLACFEESDRGRSAIYHFIAKEAENFEVVMLCRVCRVSRAAYYSWRKRGDGPSDALREEALLADQIYTIWKKTKKRYGSPRITAQLWRRGIVVSEKKVARIMAEIAITGICGPKKTCTTRRDPSKLPSPDLVERNFTADRPAKLLVGDITSIPTDEGELFLASVIDVFPRRLLGWSLQGHLRTELCLDALEAARLSSRKGSLAGAIFHTDQGAQYTSDAFRKACDEMGITQSMGSVGDSYDNAMAESLWASLKRELVYEQHFTTKKEARIAVFEWIIWYNADRLHSSLGYVPPEEFEELWWNHLTA